MGKGGQYLLSVIEYANLIDEIAKRDEKKKIGTTTIGNMTVGGASYGWTM